MPCHHRLPQRTVISLLAGTIIQRRRLCGIDVDFVVVVGQSSCPLFLSRSGRLGGAVVSSDRASSARAIFCGHCSSTCCRIVSLIRGRCLIAAVKILRALSRLLPSPNLKVSFNLYQHSARVSGSRDNNAFCQYHLAQPYRIKRCNDPFLLIPAMAVVTQHLGFGVTGTLSYEPPFQFARRMSTLDHLTKGRVGWNIVTGYLESAAKGAGLDKQGAHDLRYDIADEYMQVVYKLWEGSWDQDAVVRDRGTGIFTDRDKVRKVALSARYGPSPPTADRNNMDVKRRVCLAKRRIYL
jgi:hypothetical protein